MKSILLAVAFAFVSSAVGAQGLINEPVPTPGEPNIIKSLPIGSPLPLPDVSMKSTNGKMLSLKQAMGDGGLLVMFSCNTCPYVIKAQERTLEVMKKANAQHIGMVILNSNEGQRDGADSYKEMVKYDKKQKYTAPYLVDAQSTMADAFGATRTPEVYLFNPQGTLVYKGALEDNPSSPANSGRLFLNDAFKSLKAGTAIDPSETKSIGCSIKRVN